jgi:SAM-dependent methyltransferase
LLDDAAQIDDPGPRRIATSGAVRMTTSDAPDGAAYLAIQRHYEETLSRFGATPQGLDWPNAKDLETRFSVMLGGAPRSPTPLRLLDVGCGVGLLLDYIQAHGQADAWDYTGLDISPAMIAEARRRHPHTRFMARDLIADPDVDEAYDYAVLNGVFTVRRDVAHEEMEAFVQTLLSAVWARCRVGLAFNVMSIHVDWMRDDLFHWPLDAAAAFATRALSRHVRIRADYGLYEYTTFVYREPNVG